MAALELDGIEMRFADGHVALAGVTLEVADGELVVLVGPSGCGKSTLLRIVAGLQQPTSGRVLVGGRDVTEASPRERDVAMVFQSYALYPHMRVRKNLGFGLRMRGVPAKTVDERVRAVAARLDVERLLDAKPATLSGGERQRVALGRAIVREPALFLLDEPLSNLDAALRAEMRAELARLHAELAATMLYVTHDQEEAMTLGDRIIVLRDGAIQQSGTPGELYGRPANAFVARFIGVPAMNLLACSIEREDGSAVLSLPEAGGARVGIGSGTLALGNASTEALAGIRPHDVDVVAAGEGTLDARVAVVEPRGSDTVLLLEPMTRAHGNESSVTAVVGADAGRRRGDVVGVRLRPDRLHLFDATGRRRVN